MRRLALLALFLVAACGSVGGVQAHTISLAYKAGDTYRFSLHMVFNYTIGAQGMSIPFNLDMSAKETLKVKSVDSSGTADMSVDLTDLSLKTTINGTTNTTTTTKPTTVEVKVASDGHIVSINGSALGKTGTMPGYSGSEGGLVSAILPDKPVKPGDTWTKNYDQSNPKGSTGSIHVTSDNKYLRDEKVNNVNAAVVESKINTNLDLTFDMSALGGTALFPSTSSSSALKSMGFKGTTTNDVTSWIDSSARRIMKSHSTGSLDATLTFNVSGGTAPPGLTGPLTFKGTQTLDMNPA
jgi:hypothetical protein